MSRIAIIGAGAAAAAAHYALSQAQKIIEQVDCFSPNKRVETKPIQDSTGYSKYAEGILHGDSRLMYSSKLVSEISGSSEIGGWTNYWGATIFEWPTESFEGFEYLRRDMPAAYNLISQIIPIKSSDSEGRNIKKTNLLCSEALRSFDIKSNYLISNSQLSINEYSDSIQMGCTNCGLCLTGCPGNHIWSAKHYFSKSSTHIINGVATKLQKLNQGYLIEYQDEKNITQQSKPYTNIILALGSIQTACLLINSGFISKAVINQNDMQLIPFFMRGFPKLGGEKRISLSEVFIWQKPESGSNFFMQCYGMNSQILELILKKIKLYPQFIRKVVGPIFDRFGIAMRFEDSNISDQIKIDKDSKNEVNISVVVRSMQKASRFFDTAPFRKNGMFFIQIFRQKLRTGESYHFGNSSYYNANHKVVFDKEIGEIEGFPNISIVDSSSLPILPSYPITYTLMANAARIISRKFRVS